MMDAGVDLTRERLLQAAGEVFAEIGFRSATIREICHKAKANVAAVNYHFGDKHKLYQAAVEAAYCFRPDSFPSMFPSDWAPEKKLRQFLWLWLSQQLSDDRPSWHMKLMLREMSDPTEACAALVEGYIRPMAAILRSVILELVPVEITERQGWMIGFSVISQCLFYRIHRPIAEQLVGVDQFAELTVDMLVDHITRFSLAALGKSPPVYCVTEITGEAPS